MSRIKSLICRAAEAFPIDREKKEKLLHRLLQKLKERIRTGDEDAV